MLWRLFSRTRWILRSKFRQTITNDRVYSKGKSGISSERLYHVRTRFSEKLMVTTPEYVGADVKPRLINQSINQSWNGKQTLFHWSTENKSWPELLHWTFGADYLENSDTYISPQSAKATQSVPAREWTRLHSCWLLRVVFSRSHPFSHSIWDTVSVAPKKLPLPASVYCP